MYEDVEELQRRIKELEEGILNIRAAMGNKSVSANAWKIFDKRLMDLGLIKESIYIRERDI